MQGGGLPPAGWAAGRVSWEDCSIRGLALRRAAVPLYTRRFSSSRDRWYSHRSIREATCSWSGLVLNFLWARKKKASTKACRHIPVERKIASGCCNAPERFNPSTRLLQDPASVPTACPFWKLCLSQFTERLPGPGTMFELQSCGVGLTLFYTYGN
jgi:hypothetical protein